MESLNVSEARKKLTDIVNRVSYGNERVMLQKRGKDVAVIVSPEDLQLIERAEDMLDAAAAREALEEFRKSKKKAIPLEKIKAKILKELD